MPSKLYRSSLPLLLVACILCTAEAFIETFDDADISDWTVATTDQGLFEPSQNNSVSPLYSLHMKSTASGKAMGTSPPYALDLTTDYIISFDLLLPHTNNHWFEVFNNHHVYLVIDDPTGLRWYKAGQAAQLIMTLQTNRWYHIEIHVHPAQDTYDVFVDGQFKATCPCWPHAGFENTFRIGDRADGSTDRGEAYWDNIIVTQAPDTDGDTIPDPYDNCPTTPNPRQDDTDSDGVGDACSHCPDTPPATPVTEIGCPIGWFCADFDDDQDVDFSDFCTLALAWNTEPHHPNWNPVCNLTFPPDYRIDANDLSLFADQWLLSVQKYALLVSGSADGWMIESLMQAYNVLGDHIAVAESVLHYDDEHIFFVAPSRYQYPGPHYYPLSKSNLRSAISTLAATADADDLVLIYIISHANSDRPVYLAGKRESRCQRARRLA